MIKLIIFFIKFCFFFVYLLVSGTVLLPLAVILWNKEYTNLFNKSINNIFELMWKDLNLIKLLTILRDNLINPSYDLTIDCGLCILNSCLYHDGILSSGQYHMIKDFIKNNRPKRGEPFYVFLNSAWYWPISDIQVRIDWLNYHIKRLSDESI
jgi:hypothetical protein